MEDLEESEDLSTQNDDLITTTVVMNKYCLIMIEPEDLDAADILMQLSVSDTHSGPSTSDSPGAGSKSSSGSSKGGADDDKLVKLLKDDRESFCAISTVACADQERPSLSSSSSSFSSSSFRPAPLQKRDLLAAAAADDDDDGEEDEDGLLIDIGCGEIEGYPLRRKRKFRSILDVYAETKKQKI